MTRKHKALGLLCTGLTLGSLCAMGLSAGCSTVARPTTPTPETAGSAGASEESSQSAEWLFVTGEAPRVQGARAECVKVARALKEEAQCVGELCEHARDLGRDWLSRCEKLFPQERDEVQKLVVQTNARVAEPADKCVSEGAQFLRTTECGEPEACVKKAQRWVSRCGERYASPLVLLMLSRTLERRFSEETHVQFDRRTCSALASEVTKGVGCDGEGCKAAVDATSAWQERCYEADKGAPIELAFRMADILVGAGRPVEPIAVQNDDTPLTESAFPLVLRDHKGVIAWVCGERPKDLASYLAARKACAPGEVIVTHLDAARQVRAVSVKHRSDGEFARLFPFLELSGEREAREKAGLTEFTTQIKAASTAAEERKAQEATAKLMGALQPKAWIVPRQSDFQTVLTAADSEMVPVFKSWAQQKAAAARKIRKDEEFSMFLGRALSNPLSDTSPEGTVSPGSYVAPLSLSMARFMPQSTAAYHKELERLESELRRRQPSESRKMELRQTVQSEISSCGASEKEVQKALEETARCLFQDPACTQDKAASLSSAADSARQRADEARKNILMILASGLLSPADTERLESERVVAGCLDP